ncbi:TPA: hypothetical protein ACHV31_004153 [Klebsiella pneumoniae]|uniref:hypothetical protein n=1 Tax=Klebsiella pneumoniae TaxID=573 RepID=UPI000E2C6015|nr:hypothetical protein [Klebsiella pneumoniae]MBK5745042.1 hypothetical protein [Klebsiella pneumoniae]VVJ69397.1 Uncharacterised protein [Klebsiella pneumoniae]HBQ1631782.1 hypothetical protein [Klebsiella pneumoniae]HBQ5639305.1 hypothetical protein [Klebsiella pneumoniae]HBW5318017.1 hypothetical protein [Klebsiella pneumoniae]
MTDITELTSVQKNTNQQRISDLESDLPEWDDCKHDRAFYNDMSGRERCWSCGADL